MENCVINRKLRLLMPFVGCSCGNLKLSRMQTGSTTEKELKWSQKGTSSLTKRIIYLKVNSILERSLSRTTPFFTSQRHFHPFSVRCSMFVPLKRVVRKGFRFRKLPRAFKRRIKRAVICSASLSVAVYVLPIYGFRVRLDALNFDGGIKIHWSHWCNLLSKRFLSA